MRRIVPLTVALLAIVASGIVHGQWTDRWGAPAALAEVPARLATVALVLGDWDGEALPATGEAPRDVAGQLHRRYVHRKTGATITVALVGGRPGPVSIHSPDVCYGASGYDVVTPTRFDAPTGGEFRTARFVRTRSSEQTKLRIFWAWSANGDWRIPETPRVAFAGAGVLYKLYLIRDLPAREPPLADDPCNDFLSLLLPELKRTLFADT
jgi:hypothetical protein